LRIRSLEIAGFKSFPEPVQLVFPEGICAIVGPNGCGKSNVVDAIRWVMGEQNARHLRGRTVEEMIFAGAESKAPVGMAEVILTLDNSDGTAPGEYAAFSEIQISRRVYRGGESEYRINKVPCRLRDIVDFFLDTGVGTRGYTIVEQGHISEIVSSRPQDRRFIIEEAAGIGKYRQRRRETERKLEATEQNLVRVSDILGELRRQIGMLERQSRKARRYRELSAEVRDLDLSLAREDFDQQETRLEEARAALESLRTQSGEAEAAVARAEEGIVAAREERLRLEREMQQAGDRLHELRSEIQSLEGRIQYETREREALTALAGRRDAEIQELETQAGQSRSEEASTRRERSELDLRLEHEEGDVAQQKQEVERLSAGLAELQGRREALGRRILGLSTEAASVESRMHSMGERQRELERILRGHEEALEAGNVQLEATRREEGTLQARLAELLAEREALGRHLAGLLGQKEQSGEERTRVETELEAVRESQQRLAARLESLEEAEREALEGTTRVLDQLDDAARQRVRGMLAEVLEVRDGFERAVEAALGSRLQALLVNSPDEALTLVDQLRASGAGRATVLTLSAGDAEPEGGFVPMGRPLLEVVDAKPPYRDLLARVFSEIYLVENLSQVVQRYGVARPPAMFVTADGEILDRGGALTGGTRAAPGVVSRATEIRSARAELERLESERTRLETGRRAVVEREIGLERDVENTRSRYHSAELAVLQHEKDLERARERKKAAADSLGGSLGGKAEVLDEIERVEGEIGVLRGRGDDLVQERTEVERDVQGVATEIDERARNVERVEKGLVQRQMELASLRERRDQLESVHERVRTALRETEDWIRRRQEEVRAARERVQAFETGTAEATSQLQRSIDDEERQRLQQEETRGAFETSDRALEQVEQDLRRGTREREGLSEQITQAELRAQEVRIEGERTTERVRERYGVDLRTYEVPAEQGAIAQEDRRTQLDELRRRLEALGPVHHGAIEEYEEVSERFRYLTEQKADIEASIERLRNAIARINRTSRARFRETFEAVDREFRKTFPRLFRGGRAHLSLTEGEDVLEAGIEITASPPGKKLQNLNLLSGGEKSLTALALLFAVFTVKPSPFFFLDEVDAALDDANVGRFNDLMREMAKKSQFLLITHNKGTIEVADTLYGVTMENSGVSKLVTVDLHS
jgi:chromosome segregation protein